MNFVTVQWIRPKRYEGIIERISKSRIRGKVENNAEVRAMWRGKPYRVKIVDVNGFLWDDCDDEPLAQATPGKVNTPDKGTSVHHNATAPDPAETDADTASPPLSPPGSTSSPPPVSRAPLLQPDVALNTTPTTMGGTPRRATSASPSSQDGIIAPTASTPSLPPVSQIPLLQPDVALNTTPTTMGDTPHRTTSASPSFQDGIIASLQEQIQRMEARIQVLEEKVQATMPSKRASPACVVSDGKAFLGVGEGITTVAADVYLQAWEKATSGKDLVLKLMPHVIGEEMMARSNFFGGPVFNGKGWVTKFQLRTFQPFMALVSQAEVDFPGCFATDIERKALRDVVNGKCRKVARKLR